MQEVIQKVIAAETNAKQRVQAARKEADELLTGARAQARQLIAAAQQEARLETEKILAAAEAEAAGEKAERLARAARDLEANIRLDQATVQQAVAAALCCVRGGISLPGQDSRATEEGKSA